MDSIFYVYVWYNPLDNIPFYVGKGKGKRAYAVSGKSRNRYFVRKYRKIVSEGGTPYVLIHTDNLTESEALKLEYELIMKYKPVFEGGVLTNLSYNAGGTSVVSDETKQKLSSLSSGEGNGMSKFTHEQIVECFELMVSGLSNKHISERTLVPAHVVSDLRYGKKWRSTFELYKDRLPPKVSGLNKYNLSFEQKIAIIHEIHTRTPDVLLQHIAEKHNLPTTMIVSINLKRQWVKLWEYYLKMES